MSRPCQQRRSSAAANRKSRGSKPTGPPPIRHKARQKAIHNARHGRGGGHGGARGGARGRGRGGQAGGRGGRFAQKNGRNDSEQDFIPLSSGGNNFEALYRSSRRDDDFDLEVDGDSSDSDELLDEDMYDAQDIAINVQAPPPTMSRGRQPRAQIMFTEAAAVAVYDQIYLRNFPLTTTTTRVRYLLYQEDTSADSSAYISFAPSPLSRRSSVSSATSDGSVDEPPTPEYNPARDYVWTFGAHSGKRFTDVPDNYVKTIGGQLYKYMDKHAGLLEAFEYHRPGQARLKPPQADQPQIQPQRTQPQSSRPQPQPQPQPQSQPSQSQAPSASDTWRFKKGIHEGKRLHDVPENYIRTLENNPLVRNAWPGFKQAIEDFNAKTGRRGRV